MKVEIFINRIHKSSPYNCANYFTTIVKDATTVDEIFNSATVQEKIKETFGKKLIVQICPLSGSSYSNYFIEKTKAIETKPTI